MVVDETGKGSGSSLNFMTKSLFILEGNSIDVFLGEETSTTSVSTILLGLLIVAFIAIFSVSPIDSSNRFIKFATIPGSSAML